MSKIPDNLSVPVVGFAAYSGTGKTTLLSLVAGDNLQSYANSIELFGRRRGSGETIWDIKQHLGLVSAEFQIRYRKPLRALEVVVSGFFDSVGLYRQASCRQRRIAFAWMKQLGCADRAKRFFQNLSQGEQRLVLLARAMVKSPLMLILDEPCQGLDGGNRDRVVRMVEAIGKLRQKHDICAVGVGVPGFVDFKAGFVYNLTNVPGSFELMNDPEKLLDEFRTGMARHRDRFLMGTDYPAGMGNLNEILSQFDSLGIEGSLLDHVMMNSTKAFFDTCEERL